MTRTGWLLYFLLFALIGEIAGYHFGYRAGLHHSQPSAVVGDCQK